MPNTLITDQPEPIANLSTPIWELVIKDMLDRNADGIRKYSTPLQAFNGRHALTDLYQELLDAVVYTRQHIEEENSMHKNYTELDIASDECIEELETKLKICTDALENITNNTTNYNVASKYATEALHELTTIELCAIHGVAYSTCYC